MSDDYAIDSAVRYSIEINAAPNAVWDALTRPEHLKQWMLDDTLEVMTDGTTGGAILFRGELNGHGFENRGTIRVLEPERVFEYDYWSTLSRPKVADAPENRTTVRFELERVSYGTTLTVLLSGFPDVSIYRHVKFYWNGALIALKRFCEGRERA